ncbi:MAG: hypothetical protein HY674_20870 [Chloroflexi bacterium]|nr:hypothetical protein [Chloroflexota bacterium]
MLLSQNEKVHVMHHSYFDKAGGRTLVGTVEKCEAGVARIRGHIYAADQAKGAPSRLPEAVTRFISLVNGEHIVTPLPETVALDKVGYEQDTGGLRITDGSEWAMHLSSLTLH